MSIELVNAFDVNGGMQHVSIIYSGRNYLTMKVRSFIDFTVVQFRARHGQDAGKTQPATLALRAVA